MNPTKFPGSLSPLQRDLLLAFDGKIEGFFLTGGGALGGFYGSPRATRDLDLFTRDSFSFQAAPPALAQMARELGGEVHSLRTTPYFLRYGFTRADEQTVLDIVKEEVAAVYPPVAPTGWSLAVDQPEEIAVNKICALVGRGEYRDLEDLLFLRNLGLELDHALDMASQKDGGIGPDTFLLGLQGLSHPSKRDEELEQFRQSWVKKLTATLLPP